MRAALHTGPREPLRLADVPEPACPDDGVVLRVLACGVCRSDWHAWTGSDPVPSLPHVLGHEYAGEVVATGGRCSTWRVGDRVIAPFILACGRCADCAAGNQTVCPNQVLPGFTAPGAYAEYVAVRYADHNLVALPETMDVALAAALGCRVTTAWHALTGRASLAAGEWLVVFGLGGVGLATLLLGRALGARVVVVDVVTEKLAYATAHGAAATVDARLGDPAAAVREITGGGAHLAVEALGVTETTVASIRSLRPLGRHVQIGMPAGEHVRMALPMDRVYSGQLALFGTRGMPAWRYPSLLAVVESGQVDLSGMVARRVSLDDATQELAHFDAPAPPGVAVITEFTS